MDDVKQKEKALHRREKAFDHVFFMVLGIVAVVVGFYMYHFHDHHISLKPEDWGVFGDFIGGALNPLLAFFSFMLLLLNLKLQREQLDNAQEQLKLNQEELKLTREELKKAADAQINSAQVMNEQLKTQSLQQFDGLYSLMINQLDIFFTRVNARSLSAYVKEPKGLKILQNNLKDDQNFFRYKNYLMIVLDKIDSSNLSDKDKKTYVDLLVSSIPENYLMLLYLAFLNIDEVADITFIGRLRRFKFFQNMTLIGNMNANLRFYLIYLMKFYGEECFGVNKDFDRIRETWYYKEIIQLEKYQSLNDWILSVIQNYQYFQGVDKRLKIVFSTNGNALVYSKSEKLGGINLKSIFLYDDYIWCMGGNIEIGLKLEMTIFEEHISLELDCIDEDQDIPEYLKEQKLLYGVPRI
jgi:uncharacterized membrane protein